MSTLAAELLLMPKLNALRMRKGTDGIWRYRKPRENISTRSTDTVDVRGFATM
jgi:hypothetical protein